MSDTAYSEINSRLAFDAMMQRGWYARPVLVAVENPQGVEYSRSLWVVMTESERYVRLEGKKFEAADPHAALAQAHVAYNAKGWTPEYVDKRNSEFRQMSQASLETAE